MNTLMGIGIVFLMLLFLSFVIGLFKYIEKFQNVGKKKAAEEAPKAEEAPAPAIAQSEAADEDFADDLELVAVISAAIAAYETYFSRQFCSPFHQEIKCKMAQSLSEQEDLK